MTGSIRECYPERDVPEKERPPNREQLAELAEILATRFIPRRDLYAKQLEDGSYICVYRSLLKMHLIRHLTGDLTLGAYVLNQESKGEYLILDADDEPDWRRLKALAAYLAGEGTATYLERSRRGGHLWFFFDKPIHGQSLRRFGNGLLGHFGIEGIELFPKQDELTGGPGSLVRLPFGLHQKSGRRYGFYTPAGEPLAPTLNEQIHVLGAAETVQNGVFEHFAALAPIEPKRDDSTRFKLSQRNVAIAEDAPVSERIKAAVTVREFVGHYVELSEDGKGLCPFHDDHIESFAVNDKGNYWHCFACEMGGSVIDFWMRWRECDFQLAIRELARLLL